MSVRVRFAPSPTGKVHIGNIRAAIFNYLFARHNQGKFLLRVEDTDIERSTPEAIQALFEVMQWLDLEYDEEIFYQTSQANLHLNSAKTLTEKKHAYLHAKGESGEEAIMYRIPFNCDEIFEGIKIVEKVEAQVHNAVPFKIDYSGIYYAQISKKGLPMEADCCLAGCKDLKIFDIHNVEIFSLNENIEKILDKETSFIFENAAKITFTRRAISYQDLVKGELSKPLDGMKDMVIVRSNGTPIFHLSNVIDDITQKITHIIRGDDHVENTYRHIFLFQSLDAKAPKYAHLPMIVNAEGKPFSKRDGDAFVGDFREKGFLQQVLFNYLSLLGWSPGDDREKMSREELVSSFTLERVKSTAAQMDFKKLLHLNGQYIAEMDKNLFINEVTKMLRTEKSEYLMKVCELMQSRTNLISDCKNWNYFFCENFSIDEKAVAKNLAKPEILFMLKTATEKFADLTAWSTENIDAILKAVATDNEQSEYKLHQPFRIATTGIGNGADILEIAVLLGKEKIIARLKNVINTKK